MNSRHNLRGLILATALLATGIVAAAGTDSSSCDPMYPCFADQGTAAAVYDLAARADGQSCDSYPCYLDDAKLATTPPLTAKGLGGEHFEDHPEYRDEVQPAAVHDLAARTDTAPCDSYPCYVDDGKAVSPIAADVKAAAQVADQRI